MNRSLVISLVVMAAAVAAASAAAARQAASAKPVLLTTKGAIERVAMDGRRIAFDVEARGAGCNTVHVLDTQTKDDTVVSGAGTCIADSTSTGAGVRELAVAGRRISWITNIGGNTESNDTLFTAIAGVTKEKQLATARRTGEVDGQLNGSWLGNLAGDGDLTAVNRWTTSGGSVASATVRRVGSGLTAVHAGADSLRVVAVDSGRFAVLDGGGVLTVYRANGAKLSSFTPTGTPKEVAMRKDFVVVLTPGALEIHGTLDGTLLDTVPVAPGARDLDVHANIAVYAAANTIRAIRLSTKKAIVVATTPKKPVSLALDDAGLVYAYNPVTGVLGVGKLTFLPLSLLQAKLAVAQQAT